jgi:hypothetical protein
MSFVPAIPTQEQWLIYAKMPRSEWTAEIRHYMDTAADLVFTMEQQRLKALKEKELRELHGEVLSILAECKVPEQMDYDLVFKHSPEHAIDYANKCRELWVRHNGPPPRGYVRWLEYNNVRYQEKMANMK